MTYPARVLVASHARCVPGWSACDRSISPDNPQSRYRVTRYEGLTRNPELGRNHAFRFAAIDG